MDAERLYRELGQLVASVPQDLTDGSEAISNETHRWLGRAHALVVAAKGNMDAIKLASAVEGLTGIGKASNAHNIIAILHRALAHAELHAPAAAQGAFIPVRAGFTVFQVIGKVLNEAKKSALIVDAYMGVNALTDFAPLAPQGVSLKLLADSFSTKHAALKPALDRWTQQYGAARPLEIRLTRPRLLHDRLIILDGEHLYLLSQSLQHFAARASATVLRVDDREITEPKIYAHEQLWTSAQPL